ncbi:MAG: RsmD family RNA methyltransferase [Nostocoides sp.]
MYAGSGAVGLEAVSRGAAAATLVESDRRAASLITANVTDLALVEATVIADTVDAVLDRGPAAQAYDVAFLDPPYAMGEPELAGTLSLLLGSGWLSGSGLVIVERSTRSPEPDWPSGLSGTSSKRYGETTLWYAEMQE